MGLLDDIKGKISGILGSGESEKSGLLEGIMQMIESKGLGGLLQSFQEKGLGDVISSWVGTGENQPISADQIQEVLGGDVMQKIADKAGIPQEELSGKLAEVLPGVIDKMTPDGTIPEGGLLEKGLEFIKGKIS